jgi:hypothetical protein
MLRQLFCESVITAAAPVLGKEYRASIKTPGMATYFLVE